mmetsp:Transcript_24709/g.59575  ORF Transcript_24709/g.59575 Transcript_24709/m.59575 type:complete len:289 (-) Transcript_24709:99-965(-)|eukprot:CAMPEP_0181101762 /NCGR_PEP_ID=MMETSP1071-20121207/13938_1 /TAXON_ID=35127 /ORGANISM="Thalassiosira sp., Strain NH16" /LENGTH=288 /DNA_ID=CAMNT_0023184657 /DNA_START=44 /DNA_END=910 /DNA_ORIENTATION=-
MVMTVFPILSVALGLVLTTAASAATSSPSPPRTTYTKASFVPPAAPSLVSPLKPVKSSAGWPSTVNQRSRTQQQNIIANGYGTFHTASVSLNAKKKKKGGASANAPKKGKVKVKLLESVPGIGQTGEIVLVSSAVFQNQLKLTNKARLMSEEELQKIEQEREEHAKELEEMAMKTKDMLEEAMVENLGGDDQCETDAAICGVALKMRRKAGPEGNLFGGVNPKMVMEALKAQYPEGGWDGKQLKVTEVKDMDGKDVKKKDIKHTGDYSVSVALGQGVDSTFILSVLAE